MLEKYIDTQEEVTKLLLNSLKNKKLVQAYMFCSEDMEFLFEYAKDFSKNLICESLKEDNIKKICNKIDKNEYEELIIIEPVNGMIKIGQIDELKNELATKPVIGKRKVYIVKSCEKLNLVSANSMLKFIEDAEEDIISIFLTENIDLVIPTIKSRCQVLNFKNIESNDKYKFLDIELRKLDNIDELVDKSLQFIKVLEKNGINTFYKNNELLYDSFKTKLESQVLINVILYFYYDVFNYKISKKIKYFDKIDSEFVIETSKKNIDELTNIIFKIEKIKENSFYNLNQKLLFDRIVLELSEV